MLKNHSAFTMVVVVANIGRSMKTEETMSTEKTKDKIIKLLQKSKEYIWMSTGLYPKFYNDNDVRNAIVEAFKGVKEVRVIIDDYTEAKKSEVSWFFELAKELKDKVKVRQSEETLHWVIADGKHFRLEMPHAAGVGINNLFVCDMNQPAVSEMLKSKFDTWWFNAKPVDI